MIKKLRENKFFSEKGSVTLFILIAIIFFLIVSLNVYSSNKNKLIAQTEEIKAIEENYNKDLDNMDEIYDSLIKADFKTVFIKQSSINSPNKVEYNLSEWTNENVIVKVTVYTENNPDAQLQVKVTSKKTGSTNTYNKSQVDNNEVIITENSTVVVTFGDKEQRFELTKFDKEIPVLFYDSFYVKNNGKYVSGTWTNQETYTTISVKEEISGIPEMYYSTDKQNWIKLDFNQSNGIYQELNKYCGKEIWTLKDGRIENIYFRAKDRAGNYSNISNIYQLRYDLTAPSKPIIENNYNDNWTNKEVEIVAKSNDSLSKVKKIEYSYDEIDWNSDWKGTLQINGNEASILGIWNNSYNGKIYVRATDNAGNTSETAYTTLKQDLIPPTVNITPNGNTYYIPAGGKTTLKAKLEALDNESGLHTLEYAWSTSNTVEPINWETFENGKEIVKNDATSGTYYLWTNVIDNVGNKASKIKVSNPFIVSSNNSEAFKIVITSTPTTWTKDNVNITITYGSALTQGKKAGMGISIEEAKNAASENTANQMVVTTNNYYIYAEAIDGNGNKVTATKQITNIDKIAPTVELGTNGGTYTVAQNSNFAQITTSINAQDVNGSGLNTLEYQISSSSTLPLDDDPNWKTFTNGNIITENISGGIWYLYTKVTDNAGNRAINIQKSNPYIANYSVIYDANGGKGAPDSQIKEHNKTITLSTIQPSRTGYTFIGWSTNKSSSTAEYQPGATYTNNASATLYAVWQAKQIEVTFVRNTSSTDNTSVKQTFTYGVTEQKFSDKGWTKTGYTLLGWNKDRDASTAQYSVLSEVSDTWINTNSPKITIYAIWELNSYSLTVNPNGGTWNSTTENSVFTQNYGTTKTIANPTAPTGYKVTFNGNGGSTPSAITSTKSFSGWTNSGSGILSGTTYTFGAGNGTLTANYTNNSITLPTPTKTGYTFTGWYDAANGGNKVGDGGTAYTPTSEKTLYAHWIAGQYTLTVNPNGGTWNGTTMSSTFSQDYGTTKEIVNPIAPAGYKIIFNGNGGSTPSVQTSTKTFTNWSHSGAGSLSGTTYTFGAGNGTLTANYKNNSITLPTPTRTGYTFTGWYDAANGGNKVGDGGTAYTPTSEKTLYAHWIAGQYTLTVNPNGGTWNGTTMSSTFSQDYGTTKEIVNPIAPAGYKIIFNGNGGSTPSVQTSTKTFTNWSHSGAGSLSGTTYTFGAGNGTLTANYKNNSITLPTPTRTGYTFTGWYDAANGGNKVGDGGTAYTPTSEKTLYAHWTINQYTLTVNPNGGTWNGTTASSTFTQNYASTKAIANPTAPAGYKVTFNGNGGSTPSAITSTKSFTSWTNSGSGTLSGTTYTFGAGNGTLTANYKNNSITLPTPTRTGYTFTGWYDAANGGNKVGDGGTAYTPTSEKTLYAHWTINQYTLTVNPNGGTWNGTTASSTFTQNYASTKAIANPTAPAGYKVTFNGNGGSTPSAITSTKSFTSWTNSGSGTLSGTTYTFGAGNGTLTANYKNNSITLPTPTKTGYTFTGWYDAANGGNKVGDGGTAYTPTSEKTLYAHWIAGQYTLTVNPNGGTWNGTTMSSTFSQDYGTTKEIVNPIAPAGYKIIFNGNGGSTPSVQTSTKTFTNWSHSGAGSLSGTTYTFGAGNGTLTANYTNNSITLPTPTRTGYTFTGWYDAASGGNKIGNAGAAYTPTSAKTLYAHWTINQYTLTVNPNGGTWNGTTASSTFTQNYASTKAIANPTAPAGYKVTFNGNGGSTPSAITSTKSFTSWTKGGSGTLSGTTYTFGAGNGTLTANYKNNSITLPTPTKTGYTFTGWYDAANGGNKVGDGGTAYTPTSEKTLYAHWIAGQYTLTVNPNGGTWNGTTMSSTFSQDYGTTKEIVNPIAPAGYKIIFNGNGGSTPSVQTSTKTFTNWSHSGAGSLSGTTYTFGAGNGTLTANYKNNSITLPTPTRTGYTFIGWYDAASGGNKIGNAGETYTPTSAKTLYAQWTSNKYTVTYNANGGSGSIATDTISYNSSYTTKANTFTRIGYTFAGWNEKPDGTGTEWTSYIGKTWTWTYTKSITLYAQWKPKTYTVTYNANSGAGSNVVDSATFDKDYVTKDVTSIKFTKTGYTFTGWNTKQDGTGTNWTDWIGKPWKWTYDYNITLYAQWKINSYTLTVNPNGGTWNGTTASSTFTQNYASTKAIANPTAPAGYKVTFNGNGGSTPSAITSTKSFTSWTNSGSGTLSGTTYTFGAGNGTLTANYKNNSITLPTPTRTGYTFTGWYDAASGGNKIGNAGAAYTPTSAKTLYAHWTINQYTLTVNPNGGTWNGTTASSTFTQNYASTKAIANPTAPAGYKVTFNGNGGSTPSAITSTKSFTSWTNSGSGTLSGTTYTFGAGNGTLTANYTNNSITLPTPTRTGYTFAGWYDAASGGNKIGNAGAAYTPTSAKTLYAHWTINQYTLTVNPNGGTWNGTTASSTFTQNYASTKAIANPTAPAGYKVTFNGNGGSTPSAITSTKSFTSWTNSGSGTLSGTTYTFGAGNGTLTANYKNNSITLPTPTRTGYTFAGWYDAASGGNKIGNAGAAYTPTSAKTLYAHWTINQYTLTVNPNGGTWNGTTASSTFTQNYASTKAIANPTAPAGYKVTFNGNGGSTPSAITSTKSFTSWTKGGSGTLSGTTYTFGAGNGTLTANYTNNSITLPTPTRTGYTFTGWYDAASGGNKIGNGGATYTPTYNRTMYAHWADTQAPVINKFELGDITASSIKVEVNATDNVAIQKYEFYLDNVLKGTLTTSSTSASYTYTNLTPLKTYSLKVVVRDTSGNSSTKTITKKLTNVVEIKNVKRDGYDVYAYTDATGIQEVLFPTWTEKNNQDDMIWKAGTLEKTGVYYFRVNVSDHNYEYGKYNTHAYYNTANQKNIFIAGTSTEIKSEKYLTTKNINREGFDIEYYTDSPGLSKVEFPVWTEKKIGNTTQDDIKWYAAKSVGNGAYTYHVGVASHNYESGKYNIHTYEKNASGVSNLTLGTSATVPNTEMAYIWNVTSKGYNVTVYTNRSNVSEVLLPTWTNKNSQDDIEWITTIPLGNGAYIGEVKVSNHNYESGWYNTHVYAKINGKDQMITTLGVNIVAESPPAHTCNTGGYCTTLHNHSYGWSCECGGYHYQYRHPICTICGKKSPVSWFKCPNRPEGIPMNCPG